MANQGVRQKNNILCQSNKPRIPHYSLPDLVDAFVDTVIIETKYAAGKTRMSIPKKKFNKKSWSVGTRSLKFEKIWMLDGITTIWCFIAI